MAKASYVRARTSVWWDVENWQVPEDVDARRIDESIISALHKSNCKGPMSLFAYGDPNRIPVMVKEALDSTGIALKHAPSGVEDDDPIDKQILVDMLLWAWDNPAPKNVVLISSGNIDYFQYTLNHLALRRYNILLARLSFGGNDHSPKSGSDMSIQLEDLSSAQSSRQRQQYTEDSRIL